MQTLSSKIKTILKSKDLEVLAKELGYVNIQKGISRINELVDIDYFGLIYEGYGKFDGVHANQTLFKALCKICEIGNDEIERELYAIELIKESLRQANYKHIFVNTNFKRKSEPIFVLVVLQSKRYINNLNYLQQFCLEKQISKVAEIVKNHHEVNDGKLKVWGEISSYAYYYDKNKKPIVFGCDGSLIDGGEIFISHGSVSPDIFKLGIL